MVNNVTLDCRELRRRDRAHDYLAETLHFPDYYGRNLDALADCLAELGQCRISLEGAEELRWEGGYGLKILKVLEEAARENPGLILEDARQK